MYASGEDVRGLWTSNAHENWTPDADTGGVYADNNTERGRMSEWRREGRRENTYDVAAQGDSCRPPVLALAL